MIDGIAAARTLLGFTNLTPGMCLHYVWQAYKAHGARANGSWPTAYAAWLDTPGKHEGDRNPPPGVPVWFGPRAGSAAGDVVISLGGGRVACTDYPTWGRVGTCTIDERQRQISRPYLGWTETILGATIALPTTTQPEEEEEDMIDPKVLADALLNYPAFDGGPTVSVVLREAHQVYNAMFFGGESMQDGGKPLQQSVAEIQQKQ